MIKKKAFIYFMVTINKYYSIDHAHMDQAFLESEGITSYILDSNLSGLFGAPIIGGIRLQVDHVNANRAKKILEEHGIDTNDFLTHQCPKCHGYETRIDQQFSLINLFKRLFKKQTSPVFYRTISCSDCKHVWL